MLENESYLSVLKRLIKDNLVEFKLIINTLLKKTIMSKPVSYLVAILACAVYIVLFVAVISLLGGDIQRLGALWKILFLALPVMTIWGVITEKAKNENEEKQMGLKEEEEVSK